VFACGSRPTWLSLVRVVEVTGDEFSPDRPNPTAAAGVSTSVSAVAEPDVALRTRSTTDFDELFAQHYERLVRALTLVAGDRESACDAVQEAFVKAHLKWRKISRYDDPVGWVRRVAINKIRDGHRRRGRKDRAIVRLAGRTELTSQPPDIDEFDRLLDALPKQQRAATALYYVDGLSVVEIAVALEIAEGSVKSHLHDARRRLRPMLEGELR
jgi:RNA polymerase sigma-70 factor (ECF subfamily)